MYKLLSSDLDLTMIDDTFTLPEINIGAVAKAHDAGCLVVINSGRAPSSILPYEEKLGLVKEGCYGIAFNGSRVYETVSRKPIWDVRLGNDLAMEILGIISQEGECGIAYVGDDMYILKQNSEWVAGYLNKASHPYTEVENFDEIEDSISKVLVAARQEALTPLHGKIDDISRGRFNSVRTAPILLEFMSPEASKGNALRFLAEYLGISQQETIAIGDFFNDISALMYAGLPVAVANATSELKELARYITLKNCMEGAFAEVVDKFVLGT